MSQSVQARLDFFSLRGDAKKYERLVQSENYRSLPEEDRLALKDLAASSRDSAKVREVELERVVQKLVPKDFFPFAQPPKQNDAAYHAMNNKLADLRDEVKTLYETVGKLQAAAVALKPALESSLSAAAMKPEDGEVAESSTRPRKRRRLSVDDGSAGLSRAPPTAEEFGKLQDKLNSLEDRVSELDNDLVQYDSRFEQEVEEQFEYQLGDIGLDKGKGRATNLELTEKVLQLAHDATHAAEKANEITSALEKLELSGKNQDEENERLRTQNEELRKAIAEVCLNDHFGVNGIAR